MVLLMFNNLELDMFLKLMTVLLQLRRRDKISNCISKYMTVGECFDLNLGVTV